METGVLLKLKHEAVIREEILRRSPSLDPEPFVQMWLDQMYENSKETGEILVLMSPEITRILRQGIQESHA